MSTTLRNYLQRRAKKKGQAIVEFALALPLLLLILFGVIEFGRLVQAWLTVQNSARFGLRYAVTGEFYKQYCDEAAVALHLEDEDTYDGDPAGDCHVPDAYGTNARSLTDRLVDWARLPSIKDNAHVGAAGIWLDEATVVSGDYLAYLVSHNFVDLGNPTERGYFHITVCSVTRDRDSNGINDFAIDESTDPKTCYDIPNNIYMDDAGGPGDRVRVIVTYMHPVILPFISNIWPEIPLTAWREGIVERFRTSRVSGIGSQIIDIPTRTPIPPPVDTFTPTPTATNTSTPTVVPDCRLYTLGSFSFANGAANPNYAQIQIGVNNNDVAPVHVTSMSIDWSYAEQVGEMMNYPNLQMDWIKWTNNYVWGGAGEGLDPNDANSPTNPAGEPSWLGPLYLGAGSTDQILFDLDNNWDDFGTSGLVIPTDFGITVNLDNGCVLEQPPMARPLPMPNCDLYSMSDFTLLNNGNLQMSVFNGDQLNAHVSGIQVVWEYVEDLLAARGDPSLRMDYFEFSQFGGVSVWGGGAGGAVDYASSTDTRVDSPATWTGPVDFNAGINYIFNMDMDKSSENPATWMSDLGVLSSDFGVTIDFDNGCQLNRNATLRPPSCDLIYSNGVRMNGDSFEIRVRNDNPTSAFITQTRLLWPTNWSPNMYFDYFRFLNDTYYNTNSYSSPVSASENSLSLNPNTQSWWDADFENYPTSITQEGCFTGELTFDFGGLTCIVRNNLCVTPTPTPTATSNFTATPTRTRAPANTPTVRSAPSSTPVIPTLTEGPAATPTTTRVPTNTPATPTSTTRPSTPTITMTPCQTPPDLGGCQ